MSVIKVYLIISAMKYFGSYAVLIALLFVSCHKERIEREKKYSGYFTFTYTKSHLDIPSQTFITDTTIIYYGTITSFRPANASKTASYFIIKFRPTDVFKVQIDGKGEIFDIYHSAMSVHGGFSSDNTMYCRWGNFTALENIEGVRRY